MPTVRTLFDCKHEQDIELTIDDDVEIPDVVRGIGKCPDCKDGGRLVAISGVAPQPGGKRIVLDTILMFPVED